MLLSKLLLISVAIWTLDASSIVVYAEEELYRPTDLLVVLSTSTISPKERSTQLAKKTGGKILHPQVTPGQPDPTLNGRLFWCRYSKTDAEKVERIKDLLRKETDVQWVQSYREIHDSRNASEVYIEGSRHSQ